MKDNNTIKNAFIDTMPIFAGYLFLGIGFGVLFTTKVHSVGWAVIMSLSVFAGSMQYVSVNMFNGGVSLWSVIVTTLLVNARHLFYGISMLERYKSIPFWKKSYMIFGLTDETYSLICSKNHETLPDNERYYFWVSLFDHTYWVFGSLVGALLGSYIKYDLTGVDFALTALFVTIFTEQWVSSLNHAPAVLGVVITLGCLIIFGKGSFLIPSVLLITISMLFLRKWSREVENG